MAPRAVPRRQNSAPTKAGANCAIAEKASSPISDSAEASATAR